MSPVQDVKLALAKRHFRRAALERSEYHVYEPLTSLSSLRRSDNEGSYLANIVRLIFVEEELRITAKGPQHYFPCLFYIEV